MKAGRRSTLILGAALLATLALSSCGVTRIAIARAQPRDSFLALDDHPQVRYAPGSQVLAKRIAIGVEAAQQQVESWHGAPFLDAAPIFVCRIDCFTRFVPVGRDVSAAQFADAVFLNEDVLAERETRHGMPPERFLTHELAHVLLYQRAGMFGYLRVPAWFREGIAVAASDGAGAEGSSPREAALEVLAGRAFDPGERGSVLRNRTAPSYGLRHAIFYRQASMFVDFLRHRDPQRFQSAIDAVLGGDFQQSFAAAYGGPLAGQWAGFVESLRQQYSPGR